MEPPEDATPTPTRASLPLWKRLLRMLAVGYALWCVTLFVLEPRLLYLGDQAGPPLSEQAIASIEGLERLWVEQDDGLATECWILRAKSERSRGLVAFLHGNGELIDHALSDAREWNSRGFDVVLPEYRGYGRTAGSPSQGAIVADALKAIDAAETRLRPASVILHGRSLGSGVAAQVAASRLDRIAALVLESPFESIASFAWSYGVPPFIVRNPYRTDEVLPRLNAPILLLASRDDEIVPFAHAERLAALAPTATLVELRGTHNSGLAASAEYTRAIDALVASLSDPQPARQK